MDELHGRRHPQLREALNVLQREQLRVLDPLPQTERLPDLARRLERVERVPVRAVADRVDRDGKPCLGTAADDLGQLGAARDPHAAAVEHPRRLGAERAVHEHLQVAQPEVGAAHPGQRVFRVEPFEERKAAEPVVLVRHRGVDRRHAAQRGELEPGPHRVEALRLGVRRLDVRLAEVPRRILAQHAGGLAARIHLDDAAGRAQIAVRGGERG